ncbi:MAG: helix-turn-helix transcriptional regulator [Blautia sp.]|nr:helix-turn-helix transcriptional regulator [Blautia sp.]
MFNYDPLWNTMKEQGITTYALQTFFGFSRGTTDALKHNRNVTLQTIDDLGQVLGVSIDKIVEIQKAPDTEEMLQRRQAYLKSWERKTRKKMKTDEEEEKA